MLDIQVYFLGLKLVVKIVRAEDRVAELWCREEKILSLKF